MSHYIVEVNIFIAPLEVMNDPLIGKLFLHYENVLEELNNPFINVKVVKFSNHGLLVLQVEFILINKCITLINNVSNVVKEGSI